ncbi:MAG: LytTR family DNA-binding domain-containing protein [Polyangiales bacterium]
MSEPQTLKVIVVDDEPLARDELRFLLDQCEGVEVIAEAAGAKEALDVVESVDLHVAFLDLRMRGPDGIALAESLLHKLPELSVVIVSAHDDAALAAFEARVFDYLLKPVRLERLQATVERLHEKHGRRSVVPLDRLAVKRRGTYVVVDLNDVVYFEVKDELVWAVTKTDRFAVDKTLGDLETALDGDRFFRSHRGAIVAINAISSIEPAGASTYELTLDHPDQPKIPLARERAKRLKERIPFIG